MDAEETMVYRALEAWLTHHCAIGLWLTHNYDAAHWEPIFAKAQADIDAVREWAKALPHGNIRAYYLQWLTYYYQHGLDEARKELRTQKEKKSADAYRRENEATQKAIAEYSGEIPKPPM